MYVQSGECGEILTRVAFMRPASVCPTRIESSSVAKARSYHCHISRGEDEVAQLMLTFARGIMARKATVALHDQQQVHMWPNTQLTDEGKGLVLLCAREGKVHGPLQSPVRSYVIGRSDGTHRDGYEHEQNVKPCQE